MDDNLLRLQMKQIMNDQLIGYPVGSGVLVGGANNDPIRKRRRTIPSKCVYKPRTKRCHTRKGGVLIGGYTKRPLTNWQKCLQKNACKGLTMSDIRKDYYKKNKNGKPRCIVSKNVPSKKCEIRRKKNILYRKKQLQRKINIMKKAKKKIEMNIKKSELQKKNIK